MARPLLSLPARAVSGVFENHAFVFFDRENRQFDKPDTDVALSWQRWKKHVVDAQDSDC